MTIPITDESLRPFLFGPTPETEQFYSDKGDIYCLRESCEGCPLNNGKCEFIESEMELSPNPNTRRALAVEDKAFLILKNTKPIKEIEYLTYNERMSMYESNLHWVLEPIKQLRILKGQIRFYGTQEEFNQSKYVNDFKVIKEYIPKYRLYSLDYSAIEPRLATIVTREPEWLKVFEGELKVVARQVAIEDQNPQKSSFLRNDNKLYCILEGELDKETFAGQCDKCQYKNSCTTIENYTRQVAGDWHSKNAIAFYRDRFTKETDKYKVKEMRSKSKAAGLALIYGAYIYALARTLNCSVEEAQQLMDNFFSALPVVKKFMANHTRQAIEQQATGNMFKRFCNLEALVKGGDKKLLSKAKSIALNHPIQSLGADFLKLGMNNVRDLLIKNRYNIMSEMKLQQQIDLSEETIVAFIADIHDEVVYLMDENKDETLVPEIYTVMRLLDILSQFKVNFKLELDCEFDENRSWTSRRTFYTSKIFMLGEVFKNSSASVKKADTVLFDIKDIDEDFLKYLAKNISEEGYFIAIKDGEACVMAEYKIKDLSILNGKKYTLVSVN